MLSQISMRRCLANQTPLVSEIICYMNSKTRLLWVALRLRWVNKDNYKAKVSVKVTDSCYKFVSIKPSPPKGMVGIPEMQYITIEFSHESKECAAMLSEVVKEVSGLHSSSHQLGVTVIVLVNNEFAGTVHQDFPKLGKLGVTLPLVIDWKSPAANEAKPASIVAAAICKEFDLLKIRSWPESKVVMERQCRRAGPIRICTDVPVLYIRTCELHLSARICHPQLKDIIHDVEDCLRKAAIAGIIAALLTQSPAAGSAVLEAFLKACLESKAIERTSELHVEIHPQTTSCGEWKRKT
jgi:hypothetical protein